MAPRTDPAKKETKVCPSCGRTFTYYKCWPKTYCSRACQKASPLTHLTTNCPTCGKQFPYLASWPRKYCSRTCAAKNTASNIGHWARSAYTATCEQCGEPFETTPKRTRGRFCSRACHGKWLAVHNVGTAHPKTGTKGVRPTNAGPITEATCVVCGATYITKRSYIATDRTKCCSVECRRKFQSSAVSGSQNGNWRGGYQPYYGPNWRQQRRATRRRDNYTCRECGITEARLGKQLDVHHIVRFGAFADYREANKVENLISLCPACHSRSEHRFAPKTQLA